LIVPANADARAMIWVAALAIAVNVATALLFARGRASDINVRAAFQHMAADAGVSAGVVVAGALIMWTGRQWIDPAMSIVVAGVILWGSIGLLKEALGMSLMGVPAGIEVGEVKIALARLEGVETVHDLHVWPLSTTETALTAHLVAPGVESTDALLTAARRMLHDRFAIEHCTLQVERIHLEDTEC
jgi:cobalt-zinc-cadmium efflux system protein